MMVGIAGTPGTGKTSVGDVLARRGHRVVRVAETIGPFVIAEEEGVREVDQEAWAAAFVPVDGYVEGGDVLRGKANWRFMDLLNPGESFTCDPSGNLQIVMRPNQAMLLKNG